MEERVTFVSDGLKLTGVLHVPDRRGPRERRPAFLVLHGFGSNKDSGGIAATARMFVGLGSVPLRVAIRGSGGGEGGGGGGICLGQAGGARRGPGVRAPRPEIN